MTDLFGESTPYQRAPRLAWYWASPASSQRCRHRGCRRLVVFLKNVNTGRWMPFDRMPRAQRTEMRQTATGDRAQAMLVDLAGSHFQTCPGAADRSGRS